LAGSSGEESAPRRSWQVGDKVGNALTGLGQMFALFLDAFRELPRAVRTRTFPYGEMVHQAWFLFGVCALPTVLTAIPFGVIVALQVGTIANQIGAESFSGAINVLTVIREAGPLITALIIAGVGGSAICADLGARKVREEIDALEVLGISPVRRLVLPRLLATCGVAILLNAVVSDVGIAGGYLYSVLVTHVTPGDYLSNLTALTAVPDVIVGELKAALFGLVAGLVACHKGLNAKGGPKGVGQAVNEAVVITFILLFFINFIVTQIYFAAFPPATL
jgi:phospholipid/cholesterol/gamma-HCH transport system permease protein